MNTKPTMLEWVKLRVLDLLDDADTEGFDPHLSPGEVAICQWFDEGHAKCCLGCGRSFASPDHDQRCSSCVESGTGAEPKPVADTRVCHHHRYTAACYECRRYAERELCPCGQCVDARRPALHLSAQHMVLCPRCGNKRCPKAEYHGYQCSGSNELNQVGVPEVIEPPAPVAGEPDARLWSEECIRCRDANRIVAERDALRAQVATLQSELERATDECAAGRRRAERVGEEFEKLETALSEATARAERLEKELDRLLKYYGPAPAAPVVGVPER